MMMPILSLLRGLTASAGLLTPQAPSAPPPTPTQPSSSASTPAAPPATEPSTAPEDEGEEAELDPATPPGSADPAAELSALETPEPSGRPDRGDSYYGRLLVGPVLGVGSDLIAFGVSGTYFVIPHVAIGLDLVNVFRFGSENDYYEFQLTPQVTLLMLPRRRFTPLAWGGFGLDTFNSGLGTYGRWVTGAGVAMVLGQRVILMLGAEFDGRVPTSRWNENFECGPFEGNCSVNVGPRLGVSIAF